MLCLWAPARKEANTGTARTAATGTCSASAEPGEAEAGRAGAPRRTARSASHSCLSPCGPASCAVGGGTSAASKARTHRGFTAGQNQPSGGTARAVGRWTAHTGDRKGSAITKYHELGGLNNRTFLSHCSGGWKSKINVLASPCVFTWSSLCAHSWLCPNFLFFIKTLVILD